LGATIADPDAAIDVSDQEALAPGGWFCVGTAGGLEAVGFGSEGLVDCGASAGCEAVGDSGV